MSGICAKPWAIFVDSSIAASVKRSAPSNSTKIVHHFHQETSRDIWKRYATNHLEPAIASAVVAGTIRRDELPPELLQHITSLIEFYEAGQSA